MTELQRLTTLGQIKILADPRRLAILRRLMAAPATLSQLGRTMGESPAWVRHHLKQLEAAGLVEIDSTVISEGYLEKFYRARAGAFLFQELILPELEGRRALAILGSHDLALELLASQVHQLSAGLELLVLPVGSLDGLAALRQGLAHLTGCHLLDAETGQFNWPYVERFFPDRAMILVTLAHREQGLMLAPGNPRQIRGLEDLPRADVRLVNRNRGSGTRLWLDRQLTLRGISPEHIRGYDREVRTHTQAAQAIRQGQADAGLGLAAAARQHGLDFQPLFHERYDLVLPREQAQNKIFASLLDQIQSAGFRKSAQNLAGYDTAHTGEQTP